MSIDEAKGVWREGRRGQERRDQRKWRRAREGGRAKSAFPPIPGCRQEGCSSSAIDLTRATAERARYPAFLEREGPSAGIISFVHRPTGREIHPLAEG